VILARPRRISFLAAAGLTLVMAAEARMPPVHEPQQAQLPALALPDGEGKALVERACGGCHDPTLMMFTREDEEGWAAVVAAMAARGAKGTRSELETITRYLAANFGRTSGPVSLLPPGMAAGAASADDQQRFAAGREIYQVLCVGCHQADGRGRANVAPPLVASELALAPAGTPVRIMLHGKRGPTNVMPALGRFMTDDQIAATLTYIRREWGHTASPIDAATVKEIRSSTAGRARPWTAEELRAVGEKVKKD
jgi:mono/diheme cytochrome c family protein